MAEVHAGAAVTKAERWPLFDLMRVVAAGAVIVSHAFPLTGQRSPLLFSIGTTGVNLGRLALAVFFVLSGWLITASWGRNTGRAFACRRFGRIMPGLFAASLLGVVIGAGVTTDLAGYFTDSQTWSHLANNALMRPLAERGLPGVFDTNPEASIVNGSLWTLPHEAISYLAVAALGAAGLLHRRFVTVLAAATFVVFATELPRTFAGPTGLLWDDLTELGLWFLLGSAAYLWRDRIPWTLPAAALAVALVVATNGTPLAVVPTAFLVLYVGTRPLELHLPKRMGDPSYGMYVYAFPIQQAIVAVTPWGMNPAAHIATALPIIVGLGVVSWRVLERPALAWARGSEQRREDRRVRGVPGVVHDQVLVADLHAVRVAGVGVHQEA